MTSRVTGFIPFEESLKESMDFQHRFESLANSSRIFSKDHTSHNGEEEPDYCSCEGTDQNLEENVSLVAPCNLCGRIKEVGRVYQIPYGPETRTVWGIYPPC